MITALDDLSVLQNHDGVGVAHGGEAVRHHQGGAALHHAIEGVLHLQLGGTLPLADIARIEELDD